MKNKVYSLLILILFCSFNAKAQKNDSLSIKDQWNKILVSKKTFNTRYNSLLNSAISSLKPGKALDVAMGEGRNSLLLSQKGWDVTGFDIADVAMDTAKARAQKQNLKINAVLSSKNDFDFGINNWDLIALIYTDNICGGCCAGDPEFITKLKKSLKPGGTIVYEGYTKEAINSVFPPNSELNCKQSGCEQYSIKDAFLNSKGFKVIYYSEAYGVPDWDFSQKFAPVKLIYFIGRKE
jgi:SAM-dependent methyltransferase